MFRGIDNGESITTCRRRLDVVVYGVIGIAEGALSPADRSAPEHRSYTMQPNRRQSSFSRNGAFLSFLISFSPIFLPFIRFVRVRGKKVNSERKRKEVKDNSHF